MVKQLQGSNIMKSKKIIILRELAWVAAEFVGIVITGQLGLIEKKAIIARHFSTANRNNADASINALISNKDALKEDVMVTVGKFRKALDCMDKGIDRVSELEAAITELEIKMATTVKTEKIVDFSELEKMLIEYKNDNIFQYFKSKSNLSDGTSLSTGLNGVDNFIARITGYATALENFKRISLEIESRKSMSKTCSIGVVGGIDNQRIISMKRRELKDVQDQFRKLVTKIEKLWLSLVSQVNFVRGKIENIDQELACIVTREMSIFSMRAGSVGNVKVPIMDDHDELLAEVNAQVKQFDKVSEKTTDIFSKLRLINSL